MLVNVGNANLHISGTEDFQSITINTVVSRILTSATRPGCFRRCRSLNQLAAHPCTRLRTLYQLGEDPAKMETYSIFKSKPLHQLDQGYVEYCIFGLVGRIFFQNDSYPWVAEGKS